MASDGPPPHDPPPAYLRQGHIEPPKRADRHPPENTAGRRWGVPALIAWVTLSAFAGALWFAYEQGVRKGMQMTPPLLKADSGPTKVAPESPGGLEVPHQDKLIYERIAGSGEQPVEGEKLRPEPERPASRQEVVAAASQSTPETRRATVPVPPPALPEIRDVPAPARGDQSAARTSGATAASLPPPPPPIPARETASRAPAASSSAPEVQPPPAVPQGRAPAAGSATTVTAPVQLVPPPPAPRTASPPATGATAAAPAVAPAANIERSYRVQIGSFRDDASAQSEWTRLAGSEEALLGSLDHMVERADLGAKGVFYRLQAGPIDGASAARALCDKLKQRQVPCIVVRP
jgi:cell division protein FtsN